MKDSNRPPRHAPATIRNRGPILEVLQTVLPAAGLVLEIASGTGEHAAHFMEHLPPSLTWQPSDLDPDALFDINQHAAQSAGAPRIRPAILLDVTRWPWPVTRADAIFSANMVHIAPWAAAEGLFRNAAQVLAPGAPLILYGPFRRHGQHTAPSNEAFDQSLKAHNPAWGVRCLDQEITPLARASGFILQKIKNLPANNLIAVFHQPG